MKKQYDLIFQNGNAHERFIENYTLHMNRIQDFASRNGIDCYRMLSEEEMNYKTVWSIKDFLELDFTILKTSIEIYLWKPNSGAAKREKDIGYQKGELLN